MTEALTTTQPISLADVERMADHVVKAGLFAMKSKEQAVALMLLCQSKGLHPIQAVERYHIFNGKPTMRADAMMAEFQRRGGKVEWIISTPTECEARFHSSGLVKPISIRWTIEDAKRIGLTKKDVWIQYPTQMLRARVTTDGIRAADPGVNQGIYDPDEIPDSTRVERAVDVTPAKPSNAPRLTLESATKPAAEVEQPILVNTTTGEVLLTDHDVRVVESTDSDFLAESMPVYANAADVLKGIKALTGIGITKEEIYGLLGGDRETFEVDVDRVLPYDLDRARKLYKQRAKKD